ncbi:ATP-binding protein [Haploplasma axanthum]|uniref:Sensor histidine kinase NatK-like C-terminal domain-containing protein n=1 Tax=Haploplasma axanthum TaxID=29552 RepID=A0A449BBL2_HAPAX|nr:ATP-binding protein [Haploplasma axanthum]VEU79841.1 Uncharacterised protein [Haploplasma axanthum]
MIDFFYSHGFVIELIITSSLFVYFLKPRAKFFLRVLLCIATLFLVSIVWDKVIPSNTYLIIFKHITLFTFCFLAIMFCFKATIWESLFLETSAFTVQHSAFKLGFLVQTIIESKFENTIVSIISYLLIDLVIYILAYRLFSLKIKNEHVSSKKMNNQIVLMAVALILFTTIFQNLFEFIIDKNDLMMLIAITSYDLVSCVLVISIQFGILKNNRLTYETTVLEHVLYKQKEQMINSKHNMDILNIKYHDLKYLVNSIENRIEANELEELHKVINAYDLYVDTGNEALNIILSEKKLICDNNNIKFNYILDGQKLNFMQASDIYSLFGNAIDNAITATKKIQKMEKRNIKIVVKKVLNIVIIVIENYYEGEILFDDIFPITTKEDRNYHGYGMKSIKYIVDKYQGFMSVKSEKERFTLSISFEEQK